MAIFFNHTAVQVIVCEDHTEVTASKASISLGEFICSKL